MLHLKRQRHCIKIAKAANFRGHHYKRNLILNLFKNKSNSKLLISYLSRLEMLDLCVNIIRWKLLIKTTY